MIDNLPSLSTDLWDRDPVYRLVLRWLAKEGAGFLALPSNQVANFARVADEIQNPDDMLPSPGGKGRLEHWLNDVAKRGDERGPWRRGGEPKPLTSEIPALFEKVLQETLGNPDLPENIRFYSIWMGQETAEVVRQRKLAVLRETTAALVKRHRALRSKKEGRHGS